MLQRLAPSDQASSVSSGGTSDSSAFNVADERVALSSIGHEATGLPGGLFGTKARDPRLLLLNITRLMPSSGVQFLDLRLATDRLGLVHQRFVYDTDPTTNRTVLMPMPKEASTDGVEYHPNTGKVVDPGASQWLSGLDGVRPFLNRWVPLPYLRFMGRDEAGAPRLDAGPTNWARIFVATPDETSTSFDLETTPGLDAVVAFDTCLTDSSGLPPVPGDVGHTYTAPTTDDAVLGSTFVLEDRPEALAQLVSTPWINTWLRAVAGIGAAASAEIGGSSANGLLNTAPQMATPEFQQLDRVARYLTFLSVLQQSGRMPSIRFVDTLSPQHQVPSLGVDLIINIGNDETSALLVDDDPDGTSAASLERATTVSLRHLTRPVDIFEGAIPTGVEFDDQAFGDAHASRLSGRRDAFQWPSLVRIGHEAERLSRRASATPGITGLTSLRGRLADTDLSPSNWRFSRDTMANSAVGATGGATGRIVSGPALDHLREDGTLVGHSATSLPALRPRFSNSSILGFFIGEILVHALAQINAPSYATRLDTPVRTRTITRVIVTCPAATSHEERELLLQRAEDAVDLIWRANQWATSEATVVGRDFGDGASRNSAPPRPRVTLGLDIDLASQFVYLFDEIRGRFAGNAAEFVDLARRPRPGRRATPSLRIASIDASAERTHSAVLGYDLDRGGAMTPTLEHANQHSIGTDALVAAVVQHHVIQPIARALAHAGVSDAAAFLSDALTKGQAGSVVSDPHFAARIKGKILVPAAKALADWYTQSAPGARLGISHIQLSKLVPITDRHLAPLADAFDAAAARAGAEHFRLDQVLLTLRLRDVEATLEDGIRPLLDAIAADLGPRECDMVLLNGPLSALPIFELGLRKRLGMAPWRIINMHQKSYALLNTPRVAGSTASHSTSSHTNSPQRASRAWLTGSVGAWIASRSEVGHNQFALMTGRLPARGEFGVALADDAHGPGLRAADSEPSGQLTLVSQALHGLQRRTSGVP
jgi:hypothetical protein